MQEVFWSLQKMFSSRVQDQTNEDRQFRQIISTNLTELCRHQIIYMRMMLWCMLRRQTFPENIEIAIQKFLECSKKK